MKLNKFVNRTVKFEEIIKQNLKLFLILAYNYTTEKK
jgi:hypothetical protein